MPALISKPRAKFYSCTTNNCARLTDYTLLFDGPTDSVTRFQYTNDGIPSIQIFLECKIVSDITGTVGDTVVPRIAGVIGGTIPLGAQIQFWFRTGTSGPYSYQPAGTPPAVMQARPHGGRAAWSIIPAGGAPVTGLLMQVMNMDDDLHTGSLFDIGEIFLSDATEVNIEPGWQVTADDNTNRRYTRYRQPQPYRGVPRNVVDFTPAVLLRPDALALDATLSALDRGTPAVLSLRSTNAAGAYDAATANALTFYGDMTKQPALQHAAGDYFRFTAGQFTETPTPA